MQEDAEADGRQHHKEQKAGKELTQIVGTTMASMMAAWASKNARAGTVPRPGQEPMIEGPCKEQIEVVLEVLHKKKEDPSSMPATPPSPPSPLKHQCLQCSTREQSHHFSDATQRCML